MEEKNQSTEEMNQGAENFNESAGNPNEFDKKEIQDGKVMGILSYLGILALIPYFTEKENKWVRYHAIQGMNLMIVAIGYSIISGILNAVIKVEKTTYIWGYPATTKVTPGWVSWPLTIVSILITVVAIMGIINVCQGKAKELPVIGKIKIFK